MKKLIIIASIGFIAIIALIANDITAKNQLRNHVDNIILEYKASGDGYELQHLQDITASFDRLSNRLVFGGKYPYIKASELMKKREADVKAHIYSVGTGSGAGVFNLDQDALTKLKDNLKHLRQSM